MPASCPQARRPSTGWTSPTRGSGGTRRWWSRSRTPKNPCTWGSGAPPAPATWPGGGSVVTVLHTSCGLARSVPSVRRTWPPTSRRRFLALDRMSHRWNSFSRSLPCAPGPRDRSDWPGRRGEPDDADWREGPDLRDEAPEDRGWRGVSGRLGEAGGPGARCSGGRARRPRGARRGRPARLIWLRIRQARPRIRQARLVRHARLRTIEAARVTHLVRAPGVGRVLSSRRARSI